MRTVDGLLVLYHFPTRRGYANATTILEHVGAFDAVPGLPVWALNVAYGFPRGLRGLTVRGVALHYSLFGSGVYRLEGPWLDLLHRPGTYTVAFFQDEHHHCRQRFTWLDEHGIDCVFTHVEPEFWDATYRARTRVPRLEFNLPGYVSDDLVAAAARHARPDAERPVDVGYRGRSLAPYMGAGSQEKSEIGLRFAEAAAGAGLVLDIDTTERGRLYGEDWHRFLASCKAVLGVESGVSYMDLDDEVMTEWRSRWAARPGVTVEELMGGALGRWEGNVPYRTIGPRHFEAAAHRCCQVLYEGRYSGAMEPGVHFLALRKDLANVDEVIAQVRDPAVRAELTANAHRDLVASGAFAYERLAERVGAVLADAGITGPVSDGDVAAAERALRRGDAGRRARRRARDEAELAAMGFFRRIAPVTRPVRRALGLPLPPPVR